MTSLRELGFTELPEILGEERTFSADGWWLDGDLVEAVVVAVAPASAGEDGVEPRAGTADAAARYGIDLVDLAARRSLTGRAGESTVLDRSEERRVGRQRGDQREFLLWKKIE